MLVLDHGCHRIWHPDFTLPYQNGLFLEYAGMMDVPDYASGIRHKARAYAANDLSAMFIYPEGLAGPNWPDRLIERIVGCSECGRAYGENP